MQEPKNLRPMPPLTGLAVMALSLGLPAGLTALLARTAPFSQAWLSAWPITVTSNGVWLLAGAALFFPLAYGAALHLLGRGVESKRLLLAFAGGVYLTQCAAMWAVTDTNALWPPILTTALAAIVFNQTKPGQPDS